MTIDHARRADLYKAALENVRDFLTNSEHIIPEPEALDLHTIVCDALAEDDQGLNDPPQPAESDGWEWAIVEVFGHRPRAGRTREEERFGAKLLRIDIPVGGDAAANGWETVFYGGSSIFSFSLSDKATCNRINKPYEPPARRSLPAPEEITFDDDEF